jgi:outer membrane lipoprotein SlyB
MKKLLILVALALASSAMTAQAFGLGGGYNGGGFQGGYGGGGLGGLGGGGGGWGQQQENNPNARSYGRTDALAAGRVVPAAIVAINVVEVDPSTTATMTGRTIGGVVGGAALNRHGADKSGSTQTALTALGGLLGAIAGDAATDRMARQEAWEIVVVLKGGEMVAVTQSGDLPGQIGDIVGLLQRGSSTRLIALPQPRRSAVENDPAVIGQRYQVQ